MILIGLTGGIATGKTFVTSLIKRKRIPVIDADRVARDVVRPGKKAYRQIVKVFGGEILESDKQIDRKKLAKIIFSDPKKRKTLEAITHPEIRREIAKKIRSLKRSKGIVVSAPLLFESGLYKTMDFNLLVRTDIPTQMERLLKRDHLSEKEARLRLRAQMPTRQKERLADYRIDNSGSRVWTENQLAKILAAVGL